MGQAVLPFLGYLLLQVFVLIVGLIIIRDEKIGTSVVLKSWIFGQLILFAVLQMMAVPMILIHWKFSVLFWSYCGIAIILFGIGLWRVIKKKARIQIQFPKLSAFELFLLMVAVLLILWQVCNNIFGVHLDEDDARWLAQANDAIEYGDMMIRDHDTGDFIGQFIVRKDTSSPWPLMWAIMSRLLYTRPSIFAHSIYAPVELVLMYAVYWLIGCELINKTKSRLIFLLTVVLVNIFFGSTEYTQSTFALVRIWQGKATVAGVIIPLLIYLFICMNKKGKNSKALDWITVIIVDCAGCLMSGMGILLSAVGIGIYGVYNIIAYQRWKNIPLFVLALVPSITFMLVNMYLKG